MSNHPLVKWSDMRFDPYAQLHFPLIIYSVKYVLYSFSIKDAFNIQAKIQKFLDNDEKA